MATIRKRKAKDGTPRFTVRIRVKGSPEQSATFRRRTDARKWARQIEAAITEGRHIASSEAHKRTLAEMLDRYMADVLPRNKGEASGRHSTRYRYLWWREQIGERLLSEITPALILECRDTLARTPDLRGRQRGPATINRYMESLRAAYNVCIREWGWAETNPVMKIAKLKEPRGRVRFLADGERDRLLTACAESGDPFLYDLVIVALCTGMRQGEILGLRWRDMDLNRRTAVLKDTKNREIRAVPIVGKAFDVLTERAKHRRIDTDLIFASPNFRGEAARPITIKRPWTHARKAAEIEDFRFHDLRHSCASYLAMNGATTHEIAEVLGHKSLDMVKRYAHLSESHTSKVLGSMVANVFGDSGKEGSRRGE